jgi:hypothetical protein
MSCEAELTEDSSVYGAEIVQIVRRDRTCSRFYTGWVTNGRSARLCKGPLPTQGRTLGLRPERAGSRCCTVVPYLSPFCAEIALQEAPKALTSGSAWFLEAEIINSAKAI